MAHYASKVYAWDVVNEAFNDDGTMRHTIWYDQPGIGAGAGTKYIEQALRWAREADPSAKLFYNDYDAEEINKKSDAIYAMAKDFKKRGVPLDGIGFQTHVSLKFDDPAKLASFAKNLERFAKLGLELHITELDVRLRRFQSGLARCAGQTLRRNHDSLRAATRLQAAPDLGIHRQALVDPAVLTKGRDGHCCGMTSIRRSRPMRPCTTRWQNSKIHVGRPLSTVHGSGTSRCESRLSLGKL